MTEEHAAQMSNQEFDLSPNPRVLPMLGEINIDQWRCIAELVDNSVDAFLKAARAGSPLLAPRVDVTLPAADKDGAQLRVMDNGTGMTPETLERAVKAGWSDNNPIDSLGLFGMGFNIATARLGSLTEVWTTREGDSEWHGLAIDFDELRRNGHFRTAHLRRPKPDVKVHGTEITIKRLKPEQRKWLAKNGNQNIVRKRLSQSYSSMLRQNGVPITFDLYLNTKRVEARKHCVWDESRVIPSSGGTNVPLVFKFDYPLGDRLYCSSCMSWVSELPDDGKCPSCQSEGTVKNRTRRVTGWLGIQRYLDQTEFGIDFIRNGRKIEIGNKDLFYWHDGDAEEQEYPIDDNRNRGRIIGEVHIDHCRVSYSKDRFDRADPTWDEMATLLRGEGPLRPEKAKDLGFGPNDSPLFQLFRTFRRTSPHSKTAGAYERIMIVKDNGRASEMATYFHEGNPAYQDDSEWFKLVQEADRELLVGQSGGKTDGKAGDPLPGGIIDDPVDQPGSTSDPSPVDTEPTPPPAPVRRLVPSLSRNYTSSFLPNGIRVEAYEVEVGDTILPTGSPWALTMGDIPTRTYHFAYDPTHEVFQSLTMTPRDALLAHLAWQTSESVRMGNATPDLALILSELRDQYGEDNLLDFKTLPADASAMLVDVAKALVAACPEEDRPSLFNDLSVSQKQAVMRTLAAKKIKPTEAAADGTFLQSAPFDILKGLIETHPEYCFDGKIWDEPFADLDYGDKDISDGARNTVLSRYLGLVSDAVWLSDQDSSDLAIASREELVRAVMSLRMLRPDVERDA